MTRCAACGDEHEPQPTLCPRLGVPVTDGPCGKRVERYDVERYVGGGGFGAVYLARHSVLGQPVAIKLLRREVASNADVVARFLREARAAASIDSPHVVRVSDFGTTVDGTPFFVMELLAGRDLDAVLRSERVLPVPRAIDIALQALDGLAAAHAAGVIHRDVKPANIVLATEKGPSGGRDHTKVVDFGLSKVTLAGGAKELTMTGAVIGTPYYMPPEQFRGARDVDARADLYAMGVILYQMLSGVLPYDAPTYGQLLLKICSEPPRPLREVAPMLPGPLLDVVQRAMASEPDARFQSAQAFSEALRAVLAAPPRAQVVAAPAPVAAAPAQSVAATRAPRTPEALALLQTSESAPPALPRGSFRAWFVLVPLVLAMLVAAGWYAAPRVVPLLDPAESTTAHPPAEAPVAVVPVVVPLEPAADAEAMTATGPDGGASVSTVDDREADEELLQLVEFGAIPEMPPGLHLGAIPAIARTFGSHPAQGALAPFGEGPAKVVSGEFVGPADIDGARLVGILRRALDGLAGCRAPEGFTRVVVELFRLPGGPTIAQVSQPRAARHAETIRCATAAVGSVDLSPALPAGSGASVKLQIELPTQ